MKKVLLFVILLSGLVQLRASDTLTVRQVFNFSVGDTFDYRISYQGYPTSNSGLVQCLTYKRIIVNGSNTSINNDSISYLSNSLALDPCSDALNIDVSIKDYTLLDSSILYHDSITEKNFADSFFHFSSDTIYGHHRNSYEITLSSSHLIYPDHCPYFREVERSYIEKIGIYHSREHAIYCNPDDPAMPFDNHIEIQLIYFSNSHFSLGNPYYLSSVNDISNTPLIHLYPNPVTDHLHLSMTNAGKIECRFIVTDLLGNVVYDSAITENETNIDIGELMQGAYIWHLSSAKQSIRSGKLIKL